jgi:hypothetical protein
MFADNPEISKGEIIIFVIMVIIISSLLIFIK